MTAHPNTHSIGGIALDSDDGSLVVTNVVGLDDAAEIRTGLTERSQQDGSWDADGFYTARVVQLEGLCDAASDVDAQAFADNLRALSPRALHELVVESAARGVRSCMVRVQAGAVVEWMGDTAFTYVMTVVAPDPLLYGPPVYDSTTLAGVAGTGRTWPRVWPRDWGIAAGTTPGAAQLPNAGTAGYFPAFRIDGPVPNPVVTVNETGEWVRYNGTVLAGQWLEVDNARRRVLLNGSVDVTFNVVTSATWPSVPPGGVSVSVAADAADPAALVTAYGFEGAWS